MQTITFHRFAATGEEKLSEPGGLKDIRKLSATDRISIAREKMDALNDNIREIIHFSQLNRIFTYGNILSSQFDKPTYAYHSFSLIRKSIFEMELLKLTSIWSKFRKNVKDVSIPAVLGLMNDDNVLVSILEEYTNFEVNQVRLALSDLDREILPLVFEDETDSVKKRFTKLIGSFQDLFKESLNLMNSNEMQSLKKLRDEAIAHSGKFSLNEPASISALPLRFGDEIKITEKSIEIVKKLNLILNNTDIDFQSTVRISKRYSDSLLKNCRFNYIE